MFLDISLLVYSVCHHLSSLRSVGAFTLVFRAKHIQLNKKVCCFLGLVQGVPSGPWFYWQGWNWESDILSYPHNRYTPCCSLLSESTEKKSPAKLYSTHSVARLLTHGCLNLFRLEDVTHLKKRKAPKKGTQEKTQFSSIISWLHPFTLCSLFCFDCWPLNNPLLKNFEFIKENGFWS